MDSWLIFQPHLQMLPGMMRRLVSLPPIGWRVAPITKGGHESLARSGKTYTAKKSELRVLYGARTANRHR